MPRFRVNPQRKKPDTDPTPKIKKNSKREPPSIVVGDCSICDQPRKLDYHHWDYQNDVGVRVCRDCHEYIHRPTPAQPSETVGNEWVDAAIVQAIMRYSEYHHYITARRLLRDMKIPKRHEPHVKEIVSRL